MVVQVQSASEVQVQVQVWRCARSSEEVQLTVLRVALASHGHHSHCRQLTHQPPTLATYGSRRHYY